MATQLQIRRGTTSQMNAFTGAEGELAVNTTTDTVHVHDGSTAGGHALAKADGSNIGTYAGSFTTIAASGTITGNVTGNLTGSVLTAAQTNITSVGTLSALTVSGALTVDTNTLVVDATNNRVGIGTSSPSRALATKSSSVTVANFESTSATAGFISFSDSNTTNDVTVRAGAVGNNLVLQAGGTERLRISDAGGITGTMLEASNGEYDGSLDDLKKTGFYRSKNSNTNNPSFAYYSVVVYGNQGNVTAQIATLLSGPATYVRSFNVSWTSWVRIDD